MYNRCTYALRPCNTADATQHYDDDGDSYDRSSHKEVKYGHKHYYADGKDRDSYYDPGYGHTYDKPRHQHKGLRYTSVRHA
jgi:hypothetical protein